MAAARIQRWALLLSAYDYVIKHQPGKHNIPADALSRLPHVSNFPARDAGRNCGRLDNAVSIPPSPVDRPPPRWVAARGASLGEELWARRAVDSSQHYIDRRSPPGECRGSGGGNHSAPQRPGEATGVGA
ncbi:hypothetical protein MTO96_047355 [Rhipicephalus appendiculatus]